MRRQLRVPSLWLGLLLALTLFAGAITPVWANTTSIHLTLGNPSSAVTDPAFANNYLITRPQYALAYASADGIPRWVSWRLAVSDLGSAPRCDCFTADTSLPVGWYRVVTSNYTNSGYDRGHMTPSADRTATDADNAATFLMTNVVPQAPNNNRGPWAYLEDASRALVQTGQEAYIISGPAGTLGTLASAPVRIPAATWKAVLVLPEGENDVARVTTATRVIAIRIPNDKNDPNVKQADDWQIYQTTVDAIEAEIGDDLFNAVSPKIQRVWEARLDSGPINQTLIALSGDGQRAAPGESFLAPLTVVVRDGGDQPVAGVTVVFAALGESADARFSNSDSQIAVVTDVNGVASATVRANGFNGVYRVEASIAGVYTPATFTLTNDGEAITFQVMLPLVMTP